MRHINWNWVLTFTWAILLLGDGWLLHDQIASGNPLSIGVGIACIMIAFGGIWLTGGIHRSQGKMDAYKEMRDKLESDKERRS